MFLKGSYKTKCRTACHKKWCTCLQLPWNKHQFYKDKGKTDVYIMVHHVCITVTHTAITDIFITTHVGNCGIHYICLHNWGMHTSVTDLTVWLNFDAYWCRVIHFVSYDPIFEASATKLGVQLFSWNKMDGQLIFQFELKTESWKWIPWTKCILIMFPFSFFNLFSCCNCKKTE